MSKGLLIVYCGPSGVGKGTIMKKLLASEPNFRLSVSVTTRAPRPGEVDGRDYYFITRERFDELVAQDGLLEHAEYVGRCYGTPKAPVFEMLEKGIDVFLEIEIKGFLQVKRSYPECVSIFIMPPSFEELRQRLTDRATEPPEIIEERLRTAMEELSYKDRFDYAVINDDVDRAADEVISIIKDIKSDKQ